MPLTGQPERCSIMENNSDSSSWKSTVLASDARTAVEALQEHRGGASSAAIRTLLELISSLEQSEQTSSGGTDGQVERRESSHDGVGGNRSHKGELFDAASRYRHNPAGCGAASQALRQGAQIAKALTSKRRTGRRKRK